MDGKEQRLVGAYQFAWLQSLSDDCRIRAYAPLHASTIYLDQKVSPQHHFLQGPSLKKLPDRAKT